MKPVDSNTYLNILAAIDEAKRLLYEKPDRVYTHEELKKLLKPLSPIEELIGGKNEKNQ